MDKNDHIKSLLGGHSEHIGDWTPQQLADFVAGLQNDPTAMPHAFKAKSIELTEHLVVGGKQFEHAVIPRGVTMGDPKGKASPIYPTHSGSRALNGAYAALNPSAYKIFAETYDHRNTSADVQVGSGVMRVQAIYVPHKERLSHMYINYSTFETGGTFTYGGYALYGPLAYDQTIPGINNTQIPQVAITPTNSVNIYRAASAFFVQNGYLLVTGSPVWDVVLQPGIYFMCSLGVWSVAPTQVARLIVDQPIYPGIATAELAVPGFPEAYTIARNTLPATLDLTAAGKTFSNSRIWAALVNDNTKQI